MGSIPLSQLFTSATDQIPSHTTPDCGTKPIRYVSLHFRDRCGAAALRYRNRAKITVLMCEQKPGMVYSVNMLYSVNMPMHAMT